LPVQGSDEIKRVRANAERLGATELVAACDSELGVRGAANVSADDATRQTQAMRQVEDKDLNDAVKLAFSSQKLEGRELSLLRLIANHGNTSARDLEIQFGPGFTLYVGHLVYSRYGFFRKFMDAEQDQSSVLISKDKSSGRVFYNGFKPEVLQAFRELELI
jgi:hypothetical protein